MSTEREKLLRQLSEYGYTLFEPDKRPDPHEILAEMVKSHDPRILEGFPVVLANILAHDERVFDFTKVEKRLRLRKDRRLLHEFLALSAQLFKFYDIRALDNPNFHRFADRTEYSELLRGDSSFVIFDIRLHPERLQNTFRNYYEQDVVEARNKERAFLHEQFETEYYLSQIFSPKQKDLLMKKLRGEKMTKTEREYFSRSVKKKLLALADPDLPRMALK
jgi:hypothetical protein